MMPSINIEVKQFTFDSEGYATAVRKAVEKSLQLACRAFLMEADTRIPVRTGFLRGAFGTLGSFGTISPNNIRPEYYYPNPVGRSGLRRGVHRGGAILKTPTSGQQFATPTSGIIEATDSTLGWKFNYSVDIRYLAFNDARYGWDAWRSAIRVFTKTLTDELAFRLPSMTTYLRMINATVPGFTVSAGLGTISREEIID